MSVFLPCGELRKRYLFRFVTSHHGACADSCISPQYCIALRGGPGYCTECNSNDLRSPPSECNYGPLIFSFLIYLTFDQVCVWPPAGRSHAIALKTGGVRYPPLNTGGIRRCFLSVICVDFESCLTFLHNLLDIPDQRCS